MTNNGLSAITQGDINSDILMFAMVDSDALLEGYRVYCVFDGAVRREVIDGEVIVPVDVLIGNKARFQLLFLKNDARFYSLNILTLKLNKVIR